MLSSSLLNERPREILAGISLQIEPVVVVGIGIVGKFRASCLNTVVVCSRNCGENVYQLTQKLFIAKSELSGLV
jgi:hypothetical protein